MSAEHRPRVSPTRRGVAIVAGLGLAAAAAAAITGAADSPGTDATGRTVLVRTGAALLAAAARARRGDRIVLDPATVYTLTRTLAVDASGVVVDGRGARVRLADRAERRSDRILDLAGRGNRVTGVVFAPRPSAADASVDSWSVQLAGTGNRVDGCTVTAPAGTAIGVAGGSGHRITGNTVTGGGGIRYGWADAHGTLCAGNTVVDARANAITGTGNGTRVGGGHVVRGNRIRRAGRIGIEDWGDIAGTRIEGNSISDTALMGISAVGGRPVVAGNRLQNPGTEYGIETGASGTRVSGNVLAWAPGAPGFGTATGIVANDRWPGGSGAAVRGWASSGNRVTGAGTGLDLHGDVDDVVSDGDRFADCRERAINAAPASAGSVLIRRADIVFTGPSRRGVDLRDGICVAVVPARVEDSTVRFGPRSAGPARDFFVRVSARGTVVTRCRFDGGGRTDANRPVADTGR